MDAAKQERSTAKRLVTMSQNRAERAIREKLATDVIESRFMDADKKMCELLEKHELYLVAAGTEADQDVEENWLKEVNESFELFEDKIQKYTKEVVVEVLHTIPKAKDLDKIKRTHKYEEMLLCAAVDSLLVITGDVDAAVHTIKDAEVEMKARLDCYRKVQRELVMSVDEVDTDNIMKSMQDVVMKCTQASIEAGKVIERRMLSQRKDTSGERKGDGGESRLKMERLKMPTFSGNIRDFPRFKDDFEKQVMPTLKPSENVAYILRSCLSGEALNVVRNVDTNETDMWKRLIDRFGRATKLADVIMNDIKQLRAIGDGDDQGFLKLVNIVENSYTDLARIKMEYAISNPTIISMIEEKLPKMIKTRWCLEVCDEDDGVAFPTFLQFLLKHRRALEYGSSDIRAGSQHRQGSTHLGQGSVSRPRIARENCWIHVGLEDGAGDHPIWKCREFQALNVNQRIEQVIFNRACKACLLKGCPGARDPERCTARFRCREAGCGQRHNHLLHIAQGQAQGVTNHATDELMNVGGTALLPIQEL